MLLQSALYLVVSTWALHLSQRQAATVQTVSGALGVFYLLICGFLLMFAAFVALFRWLGV